MLGDEWFSESCGGYAVSLKVRRRLHREQSACQCIEVYETADFGRLLVLDGVIMLTSRDHFIYHEMLVHPVLCAHPGPAEVVVVGGGDCGSLREALRHPKLRRVRQVELDERVTRVAERFFPELCEANADPRAQLLFQDAISWMAQAPAQSADVIILDTTDPVGQAQRLFRAPFYRDCLRVLGAGGILAAQSESPLLDLPILQDMHDALREAGFRHRRTLYFPLSTYPSGWWSATLACRDADGEGFDPLRPPPSRLRYYNAGMHRASQAQPEFLRVELARSGDRC